MAKKISQLTQATEVKSDDVTVIVQNGETKKLPLNMMVTKQDIENKKVAGLAKLDEIEATYENDTYTPTITVKNKSSVKTGEGDEVDYSANVMDGHAKSAILKGNTLVNLLTYFMPNVDYMDGQYRIRFSNVDNFDKITIVNKNSKTIKFSYYSNAWQEYEIPAFNNVLVEIPKEVTEYNIFALDTFGWDSTNYREAMDNIVLLHGDYVNQDIPYFEGMQSVKMPVLTTTGKNTIYQVKYETLAEDIQPDSLSNVGYGILDNSDSWTLSFPSSQWIRAYGYDSNGNYTEKFTQSTQHQNKKFNIKPSNNLTKIIKFRFWTDEEPQLEKGTQATPYEPHKSNILTVNEPIELRGIGDVKDELNLLTGEAVERIGEIVLNEDITGYQDTNYSANGYSAFRITSIANIPNELRNVICDKVKYYPNINLDWTKQEEFFTSTGNLLFVKILSTKASNFEELRSFLSSSPITIQYKLETPVIKTVDLMPSGTHPSTAPYCWKNGHIQLSSSGLLPSLEYSVVTSRAGQINQNATMIVKNDKRIFDLEILLAGGLVNTTYQALTLQNQVETGLSKVSLNSETEPDYLLYHMIMKLIEEKAYKLDDLAEKVSVFYLYEKLSDEQFETIYSELYPFVEEEYIELPEDGEIIEEPIVDEVLEEAENGVVM